MVDVVTYYTKLSNIEEKGQLERKYFNKRKNNKMKERTFTLTTSENPKYTKSEINLT